MRCRHAWWVGVLGWALAGATLAENMPALTTPHGGQQWARGWIVKLKETKPQPVVRLAAAAVPSDGPSGQRLRLWQAAQRQRVVMDDHRPTAFGAQVMRAGRVLTLAEAEAQAERLRADPDVEWVVVNAIERQAATTNVLSVTDPFYPSQTWLASRTAGRAGVANFPAAWLSVAAPRPTSPVAVAVLDTGILSETTELDARILPGYDFISESAYARDGNGRDPNPRDEGDWMDASTRASSPLLFPDVCTDGDSSWHGTAIAAMLVAGVNNGVRGTGLLAPFPDVQVLPVRVGGACGADRVDILEGMLWAAGVPFTGSPTLNPNPAKVISLSFGGDDACTENTGYPRVIRQLEQAQVLLVASAGNGGDNGLGETSPTVPASCPGVMAVTALNQRGHKATYGNFVRTDNGRWGLAVAAGDVSTSNQLLDDGVVTLVNDGTTSPSSNFSMGALAGTSFAAPQVAGVAAMVWALDETLSVNQVRSILVNSARAWSVVNDELTGFNLPVCSSSQRGACRCSDETCGSGVLDAAAAVDAALNPASPLRQEVTNVSSGGSSGGGGGGGALSWPWLAGLAALWVIGAVTGRRAGFRTGRP